MSGFKCVRVYYDKYGPPAAALLLSALRGSAGHTLRSPPDCGTLCPDHGSSQHAGDEAASRPEEGPAQGAAAAGEDQREPEQAGGRPRTVHGVRAGGRCRQQRQRCVTVRLLRVQQVNESALLL